ncbi:N(4)-(Beta-N-acetylglucosaminyl)-L-asparaginase-like [Schistocerca cancellata]|uniref:N(4)-(Beta-N-acetylglucosaminyl)-L-asparaginase- like n=1 Tax=Schistocerca cancellata TaxID=274614 RepID=UPI002117968D|nr:N(4)-(Beta-N-acetylglucosaminyl)-L-asparaginase-like [Schistocerca cancellata]
MSPVTFFLLPVFAATCFAVNTITRIDPVNKLPIVINTWGFTNATAKAWEAIYQQKLSALDAVEMGCTVCEEEQCDGTVGFGGSPDENGETTLDAMLMDGTNMNIGAVGALRRIKPAISVARRVLENTRHSFLVGDQATEFAIEMGFQEESLQTENSRSIWQEWKENSCQPNFWQHVTPNPQDSCGPYKPLSNILGKPQEKQWRNEDQSHWSHDTIGMVAVDIQGNVVAGTSTNGASHKIPGRVGDSPIPGAGAYADSSIGGAAATGDGDIMMRFLPSFLAVELLRNGSSPSEAGAVAIRRIGSYYPEFKGGIVVVRNNGEYGAACHGLDFFPFSVRNLYLSEVTVQNVSCVS